MRSDLYVLAVPAELVGTNAKRDRLSIRRLTPTQVRILHLPHWSGPLPRGPDCVLRPDRPVGTPSFAEICTMVAIRRGPRPSCRSRGVNVVHRSGRSAGVGDGEQAA